MSHAGRYKRQRQDDGGRRTAQFVRAKGPTDAAGVFAHLQERSAKANAAKEGLRLKILALEKSALSQGHSLPHSRPHHLLLPAPVAPVVKRVQALRGEEQKRREGGGVAAAGCQGRAVRSHVKKEEGHSADAGFPRGHVKRSQVKKEKRDDDGLQDHIKKEKVSSERGGGQRVLIKKELGAASGSERPLADIPEAEE